MKSEIITPAPFMKIAFHCSNRQFYSVKEKVQEFSNNLIGDIYDSYVCEKCDYEGDLERLIIANCLQSKRLIDEILKFYEVEENLPDGMNLHLSIF